MKDIILHMCCYGNWHVIYSISHSDLFVYIRTGTDWILPAMHMHTMYWTGSQQKP